MAKVNGERTIILIAINMMVNIIWIKSMAMEFLAGKVEMFIKAIIRMMKEMVMEKCTGLMAQPIKVNGEKEFSMDMEL